MTTEVIKTREYFRPTPESQMSVTSDSLRAKAELKPRTANVRKNKTAQTLAPGISASARGYVRKPTVKVLSEMFESSGEYPRKPMTPKTAKPPTISYRELQMAIMRVSCTALACLLLYEA